MARRKSQKQRRRVLPQHISPLLRGFIIKAFAVFLILLGAFLIVSLVSYNIKDPSWNTTPDGVQEIANICGSVGAIVSDILIQTIGAGGYVLAFILSIWGVRILRKEEIKTWSFKIISAIAAIFLTSLMFSQFPSPSWESHPYSGGVIGTLEINSIGNLIPHTSEIINLSIAFVSGIFAVLLIAYSCAVSKAEVQMLKAFIFNLASEIKHAIASFISWLRAEEEIQRPPVKKRISPKPKLKKEAKKPAQVSAPVKASPPIAQKSQSIDTQWSIPEIDLLSEPPNESKIHKKSPQELQLCAEKLQTVLADFNVEGDIVGIHPGPVVTLYELEPSPGTKTARVISLADDIARSMAVISVRCAVIPGRNVIGIELPNDTRQTVYMHEMLDSRIYERTNANLPLILGKEISGQAVLADLSKMPHLLVAGTTGSGKSVAVNTMILSLLFSLPPEKCRFIMIDPKMLELSIYDDIPHLLTPVVTDPAKAVTALKWAVAEMEQRYRSMSKLGVRNIDGYNERLKKARDAGEVLMHKVQTGFDAENGSPTYEEVVIDLTEIPYIVIIVDEFADLMLVAGKDVENAIQRLAQMARAAGIHLIMATQRPSVDVITGVIKANFPTRISFAVTSKIDSRTILGEGGAEQLLGLGDMLYMAPGGRITRVHGPFVSDGDVEKVTNFLRDQGPPSYETSVTDESDEFGDSDVMNALFGEEGAKSSSDNVDELYDKAVAIIAREGKASTSFIQRHLQIGYNRAARIIEEMERQGVVSKASATGKRQVLVGDV